MKCYKPFEHKPGKLTSTTFATCLKEFLTDFGRAHTPFDFYTTFSTSFQFNDMTDFMMIFRSAPMGDHMPSPEEIQASIKQWQDWIGGIAAQGKFLSTNQLGGQGKVLKADGITTDGPYVELKEIVGGYIIVKAETIEEAMEFAAGCPVLHYGGNVEVREIMQLSF